MKLGGRCPQGWQFGLLCMLAAGWLYVGLTHPEWLPGCLFRGWSGYDCPACGAQRACLHLLHGEFRPALLSNPYLFLITPYLLLVLAAARFCTPAARLRQLLEHRLTIAFFTLLMLAWWLFRNTPCWHRMVASLLNNGVAM